MLTTLSATNGVLLLNSTNGLTFTLGTNGTPSMAFTATLSALNNALANLTYRPATNFAGSDQITLSVNDQGNTGTGGALMDTRFIAITVNPVNDVPSVAITGPTNGAVFIAPATITLVASLSDGDGQVVKVEFLSGTNILAALSNSPYQFFWSNAPAGIYNLTARTTDNSDAMNYSLVVTITNKQPGFVKLDHRKAMGRRSVCGLWARLGRYMTFKPRPTSMQ